MDRPNINQNPFPRMNVVPDSVERLFNLAERAWKYGRSIIKNTNVQFLPTEPLARGDHPPRGASAMLDAALDAPRLPIEGGWDDMGCYYSEGREA